MTTTGQLASFLGASAPVARVRPAVCRGVMNPTGVRALAKHPLTGLSCLPFQFEDIAPSRAPAP